ncbi:hypothetical protein MKK68_07125 [Methylobacterium sp. E-016]|uniref:hypothetical protein n=1 Tax=Methylobacterium sp. E-016 TaxID=2836556 RepID=UPI001FBAA6C7|nr:hypothetical protein [Methylobacterium sp. E-016]MCJ2075428.1 hypothetical protein [Methylobacterium sp. E-016]
MSDTDPTDNEFNLVEKAEKFEEFEPMPGPPGRAEQWEGGGPEGSGGLPRNRCRAQQEAIERRLLERHRDATGIKPNREASTIWHYRKIVASLIQQADTSPNLETIERLTWAIRWFSFGGNRWEPATIGTYRAALTWAAETMTQTLDLDVARVEELLTLLDAGPDPRGAHALPRTSSKKRMAITADEHLRLVRALVAGKTQTARLVAGIIGYGVQFDLRPREFRRAFVKGHQLVVRCAKYTNGRGIGQWRYLDLVGFSDQDVLALRDFLVSFKRAVRSASSCDAFFERLAKALSKACQSLGIPAIALYTVRHQAIDNFKRSFDRRMVAAFAGHLSQHSASRSYARRRGGGRVKPTCRPSLFSNMAVRPLPARNPKAHDAVEAPAFVR